MAQKKQHTLFNLSDKLILLYGSPLLLWPISLLSTFNIAEKVCMTLLFIVMLVGFELIFRTHKTTVKKIYKRKFQAIDDLNISFSLFLTPQVFITSILATSFGGIIGFYYINNDFFSFISIAFMFFIIILGLEFMFQDLILKPFMKNNKIETKTNLVFAADFIDYVIRSFTIFNYLLNNPAIIFYGLFGFIITYHFYFIDAFSLLFGTAIFIIIGLGISTFKKPK
ncbi:hypothetical protein CL647_02700 [bacterium]|nr:hypothetical protein [bacterium]|tara:strand:+ start:2133 stop:2807 length:675 start_codon:yes stop_codon:yes gene_type:complete